MKRIPPLSDHALRKYALERNAFQGERFDAGYATGSRLLEQGVVQWKEVERIGSYVDEVGLEEEDCTAESLYRVLTGDMNAEYEKREEWLLCHLGTAWPHPSMVHGVNVAVMDAWKQIRREQG